MGPGHPPLQGLSGDGLVRIPLLHLTAADKRETAQKWGSPQVPTSPQSPQTTPQTLSVGNCFLLALASSCLGLAEGSQGQVWAASELSSEGG